MLRSAKEVIGYRLLATDDDIGQVKDFLFDDQLWTVRYLVVDTGGWLSEWLVLIAPVSLGQPHWQSRLFPVVLTKEQIENSPGIETDRPFSRQQEADLTKYYGWPVYWPAYFGGEGLLGFGPAPVSPETARRIQEEEARRHESEDPHLRSVEEVTGYHIQAADGEIGHVEDFILDDEDWVIRYMVVDTRNWLPGKKLLVAPGWVESIDWSESKVAVDLSREEIKDSPEYDALAPVNREYEVRLYDYYGRPKYWS